MPSFEQLYRELLSQAQQLIQQEYASSPFVLSTKNTQNSLSSWEHSNNSCPPKKNKQKLSPPPSLSDRPFPPQKEKTPSSSPLIKPKLVSTPSSKENSPPSPSKEETNTKEPLLKLNPIKEPKVSFFDHLIPEMKKLFPRRKLLTPPPDDTQAKNISNQWMQTNTAADILVLSYHYSPKEKEFVNNIAKAIDKYIAPTKVLFAQEVENLKQWEVFLQSKKLKFILSEEKVFHKFPLMMKFYTKEPKGDCHFLNNVPLLTIEPPSQYLSNPKLKSTLWNCIVHYKKKYC